MAEKTMLEAATEEFLRCNGYAAKTIERQRLENSPSANWQNATRQTLLILEAAGVPALIEENAALKAKLANHQESQFHPDWSALEATRESLREAWAKLKEMEQTAADALREAANDDQNEASKTY